MDEKKPKRPRIGALNASMDASDTENRYQPLRNTSDGETSEGSTSATTTFGGYQPRRQAYQPYQRREGA